MGGAGLNTTLEKRGLDSYCLLKKEPEPEWSAQKKAIYYAYRVLMLLCACACMGILLLLFAFGHYAWGAFWGYFGSAAILLLNILPVAVLALLFYGLFGRAWLAFLLSGGITLGFSLAHYYKLLFRDDPLYFEDLLVIREAKAMTTQQSYALFVDKRIILAVLCLALGTVLLFFLVRGVARGWKRRVPLVLAAVLAAVLLRPVYLDRTVYDSIQNYDEFQRFSATQNYISRGFLYPFLHSAQEIKQTPPEGYREAAAQALLAEYEDADIPADKRVSVISYMREAYLDFSQYEIPGLDCSGYDLYHQLEAESYSGDLLTNIFGGGTIDSERCFLTGNYCLRNFRSNANSYVWYFNHQGYTVEGSHPYFAWFYNRQNVNGYLGFENYRFREGDYEFLSDYLYVEDSVLLSEVYRDFVNNKATGKPYFSFNLNIQSHGPYSTTKYNGAVEYLTGDYTEECKNAMNNYMATIMDSDVQLMKLVENLRTDPDPVVLVLFSDHKPWMGDGNAFYAEMGMYFDLGTEQGFRDYYTTRYLIWANDAAKEVLGNDFVGTGPTISPFYLMNLTFQQCGWEGPAFMQAMNDLMETFPVVTVNGGYVVDDAFTYQIPEERQTLFRNFEYLQYYWRTKFFSN